MNQPAMDRDVELLRSISGGDRQAFARFYDQYGKLLYSLAFRILADQQEAGDVLREVLGQIREQAGAWHPGLGKPFSWAVTLTRNKAVDYLHAFQNRAKLHEQAASPMLVRLPGSPTANDAVRSQLGAERIVTAIAELPEDQRRAIEATFFSGPTEPELAETLQAPPAAIYAGLRSGLAKLRERLEGFV